MFQLFALFDLNDSYVHSWAINLNNILSLSAASSTAFSIHRNIFLDVVPSSFNYQLAILNLKDQHKTHTGINIMDAAD